jgi:hypothetical protein
LRHVRDPFPEVVAFLRARIENVASRRTLSQSAIRQHDVEAHPERASAGIGVIR